ncbi:ATP-binding protein [Nocardioides sp. zg-1230]|uniref:ATP-binding protein n=1 Tax=Nocardioides sp. zg-1230 TaxID=2736601 RepID=UPI001557E052|nr:ATP-binding protein [Nocardioides sp. zg-1230]NPC44594.1 ATP-binding protein [Nocardioides sp. zg-1230]
MSELDVVLHRLAVRLADHLHAAGDEQPGWEAWLRAWATTHPGVDLGRGPDTPLDRLRFRLGLEPEEVALVVLAGMPEESDGFAGALRELHPANEGRPTVGLALRLLQPEDPSRLLAVLHGGAAVRGSALEVTGAVPFTERSLVLTEGLWGALRSYPRDGRGDEVATDGLVPGLESWLATPQVADAVRALEEPGRTLVLVLAEDETVALGRCAALATGVGTTLLARRGVPDDPRGLAALSVLAIARAELPLLVAFSSVADGGPARQLDSSLVTGPLMVAARTGSVSLSGPDPVVALRVSDVPPADQRLAWEAALPDEPAAAAELAARHSLDPALTAQLAADLSRRSRPDPTRSVGAMVTESIRGRASAALPPGSRLSTPDVGWSRLVLPRDDKSCLREAVARLELQSLVLETWGLGQAARADRGVRLLFCGPPGTGKTLAAEVVASRVGTDLLTVDVANVVSKWIGETEKNLGAVFDVAERTQAVLFMDEADALFGSRTKVSDAHDRYANLETAYLLQRLDRFQGLAVLATNLRHNIDPAFTRRMDYVIEFDLPDAEAREVMWAMHVPEPVRGTDVDLATLARRHAVPGGWIRNAALGAAYLAASSGEPVTQEQLLAALRREYAKDSRTMPAEPTSSRRSAGRLDTPDERAIRTLAATSKESS